MFFFVSCVSHAFASVQCCRVGTCWERADLLVLVGDVYCIFVTFPCVILGQVWYLNISFTDLCHLFYFLVFLATSVDIGLRSFSRYMFALISHASNQKVSRG